MMWLNRWLLTLVAASAALLAFVSSAAAQKGCDQFGAGEGSGTNPAVVRVEGKPGESVYLCGYVFVHTQGSAVEISLFSGTGQNCNTGTKIILPKLMVQPGMQLVNRIPYAYGEFTTPGHSLCTQTYGNGTVYSIFYWAQY
jgi:hypothetical protein